MTAAAVIEKQIDDQNDLQTKLLGLAVDKADILRRGDIDALNLIVAAQQDIILELSRLTRAWTASVPALAAGLGITGSPTLSELIDALPEDNRATLHQKAQQMRVVMAEAREQNEKNLAVINFELMIEDQIMRQIILEPVVHAGSDFAHQPRLVDVEA